MAANAFILVNVEPENTRGVVDRLKSIPGTVVHEVLGPYDLVVDVEADTQEEITAILRNKIRPLHGVTNTVTCLCFSVGRLAHRPRIETSTN